MIALVSAKGSPGVTVSGLALALTWPRRCLFAECDPAGGDVMAGYLGGALDARRGLAELAVAELRGRLRDEFERQLVDLDAPRRQRLLLPGLRDPAQSATVAPVWPAMADYFLSTGREGYDVIADCGRLATPHFGWPLVTSADAVLLVVRGTLPSISHAVPAISSLRRALAGATALPGAGSAAALQSATQQHTHSGPSNVHSHMSSQYPAGGYGQPFPNGAPVNSAYTNSAYTGSAPPPPAGSPYPASGQVSGASTGINTSSSSGTNPPHSGGLPAPSSPAPHGVALARPAGSTMEVPAIERIGLVVVDSGPYRPDDVARRLGLSLVGVLPHDPASARALSFGGSVHKRRPLLRAASALGPYLIQALREVAHVA